MDSSSKQRLIGVVVLIALATIVLPVLFHRSNQNQMVLNLPQDAPPPPALPDVQIAPPSASTPKTIIQHETVTTQTVNTGQDTQTLSTPTTPQTTQDQTITTSHLQPVDTKTSLPKSSNTKRVQKPTVTITKPPAQTHQKTTALTSKNQQWLVQLGSFSNKTNADKLMAHLRKHGFKAHSKTTARHTSSITKVFIGPEKNRASASWIVKKLNKTLHLKGIIVRA